MLKNIFSDKKKSMWLIIGAVVVVVLVILLGSGRTTANLAGTAGVVCNSSIIDSDPAMGQIMAASGLFLRVSPDVNAASLTALPVCSTFELLGRSPDSQWLNVNGADNEGWIFYFEEEYVRFNASVSIEDLPISNASYQQTSSSGASYTANVLISITNNTADVIISKMSSNASFYVMLASGNKSIVFTQGKADANGNAHFQKAMPGVWADGSAVLSGQLTMNVFLSQTDTQVAAQPFVYYR
ncbi:MAG: hypothetical protein H8E29_04315 [Anaerolineales bacterium]|uniref:SH3 domain-containing protein n=1 Tax=Candidatus Desulfolinea nitratireducens TaxID=2841698 RepID=A0A8J6TDY6_9CHLR|nr:hypothetical protein [Candidatus Desulfolinea nitratireducens]